jgi:hypothetical protein
MAGGLRGRWFLRGDIEDAVEKPLTRLWRSEPTAGKRLIAAGRRAIVNRRLSTHSSHFPHESVGQKPAPCKKPALHWIQRGNLKWLAEYLMLRVFAVTI